MQAGTTVSGLIATHKGVTCEDFALVQAKLYPEQTVVEVTPECILSVNPYPNINASSTPPSLSKLFEAAVAKPTSIITVLGDTGSGKSHNLSHLIGQCSVLAEYASLISGARQLVEALTCAKTLENDTSSRCTTAYELTLIKGTKSLTSCQIKIYYFEALRVTLNQLERDGEANFNFIYAVLAGRPELFSKKSHEYKYLQTKKFTYTDFDREQYRKLFDKLHQKLLLFLPAADDVDDIYKCIAAILTLGNLTFTQAGSETTVSEEVGEVASLLSVDGAEFSNILCKGDKLQEYLGTFMAQVNRDTIAKHLYRKLVLELIVDSINAKLKESARVQVDKLQTLIIYDTVGFEDFTHEVQRPTKHTTYNGLPQLLHNSVHEEMVFNILEYFRSYFDEFKTAIPQNIVKFLLLSNTTELTKEQGLFGLLKDQAQHIRTKGKENPTMAIGNKFDPNFVRVSESSILEINHFTLMKSGKSNGVLYNLADFAEQVLEDVPRRAEKMLFFSEETSKRKHTTIHYFQSDFDDISRTTARRPQFFVMCMKPCTRPKADFRFNISYMARQYNSLGLTPIFSIYTHGMEALPHNDFLTDYSFVVPDSNLPNAEHCEEILSQLNVEKSEYIIGLSHVFVSPACHALLRRTKQDEHNFVIGTPKKAPTPSVLTPTQALSLAKFTNGEKNTLRHKINNLNNMNINNINNINLTNSDTEDDISVAAENDRGQTKSTAAPKNLFGNNEDKANNDSNNNNNNTNDNIDINRVIRANTISLDDKKTTSQNSHTAMLYSSKKPPPEPSKAVLLNNTIDDEATARAAVAERLARRRDQKKQQNRDSSGKSTSHTSSSKKGKEKSGPLFADSWGLIARASELQTNALKDKKVIPDLANAIESSIGLILSAKNIESLPDILCPFLAEHGHKYLPESSLYSMSKLFFSFKLDPNNEYSRIYRLDRMVLEILHQKNSFPQNNLLEDGEFTEEVAAEFALLSAERMQRELYRDPANFDGNSVSLTLRALTLLVSERVPQNNVTTRVFMSFGLLESLAIMLVKLTNPSRAAPPPSPSIATLSEDLASLFRSCSVHEYLGEYFKNNGGYHGLVQSMGNLVESATEPTNEKTIEIILRTLISLEKRYYGNLIKISTIHQGSKVKLHNVLLSILKSSRFGDTIYTLTFELCKSTSPVFYNAKRNELPCALASFYAAGKFVQLYRSTLTSGALHLLSTLPSSSTSSLPPPPNDWTPLLCTLLLHFLHFHKQKHVVHAFETLLLLKTTDTLWRAMVEMVEGVGVHGFHQLGELDRRPASLSTPSILSKWLSENGSKLATYCNTTLEHFQIKYQVYSI